MFRLLTYNIHKAIGVDRRFDPDRIAAVLEYHDADIVLLQEVDRGVPRSDHFDLASHLAKRLRYDFRAVGMNVFLKKGRYGNATLTRFPIGRQHNLDLTVGARKRRGAQHTRIIIPAHGRSAAMTLDVFNVHLGLLATERRRQVARLLASPDVAHLHESDACIIAGDMNDWRGMLRRQRFAPAGFQCATNRRPVSRWSIRTFPSYAPTGGLDKVFYRGSLRLLHAYRSRLRVAKVASDHLPVIVEFEPTIRVG
ncbi:MAG: endonuclease [Phycisphaerales bacterium]|nr:endonuclease [Phycisphaerales bacterium]